MPRRPSTATPSYGAGELRYSGFKGLVDYTIDGDVAALSPRSQPMRGRFTAPPEVALDAFKAGDGYLTLDSGKACRIVVLAHSAGSDTAYFEIRI
jgi:hypothetical protein